MKRAIKWKALAVELELIAKEVLSKEFLPKKLYYAYKKQALRLKIEANNLSTSQSGPICRNLEVIEGRLRVLNPKRCMQNFKFFTRKINHFQERLDILKEQLVAFEEGSHSFCIHHIKHAAIQKEIAVLERHIAEAVSQQKVLLK